MNKNKTFITLTLLLLSSVATTPGFSKEAKKEEKETRSAEEKDFNKELKDLIALDFDLIESYDSAFKRLEALRSNESNTNDAYTRMNGRSFIPQDMKDSLSQGLQDKARHLAWFDEVLK